LGKILAFLEKILYNYDKLSRRIKEMGGGIE